LSGIKRFVCYIVLYRVYAIGWRNVIVSDNWFLINDFKKYIEEEKGHYQNLFRHFGRDGSKSQMFKS